MLSLTWNFGSSSPVFSISFYLPFFALHVCRLIHKLSLCFVVHVVFKIIFFFSNAVGNAISCQTNAAGSAVGHPFSRRFEGLISHCLHGGAYVRTLYGRSDGSDVITKPKFLALMGLPKSLSYGAPLARALWRARELRYKRKMSI